MTVAGQAGAQLTIADCAGTGGSQRWAYDSAARTFSATVDGAVYCLDAYGSETGNGTRVIGWPCTGQPNQQWTVDEADNTITGVPSGRCLAVTGTATANDSPLEIWDCTKNATNQQWRRPA